MEHKLNTKKHGKYLASLTDLQVRIGLLMAAEAPHTSRQAGRQIVGAEPHYSRRKGLAGLLYGGLGEVEGLLEKSTENSIYLKLHQLLRKHKHNTKKHSNCLDSLADLQVRIGLLMAAETPHPSRQAGRQIDGAEPRYSQGEGLADPLHGDLGKIEELLGKSTKNSIYLKLCQLLRKHKQDTEKHSMCLASVAYLQEASRQADKGGRALLLSQGRFSWPPAVWPGQDGGAAWKVHRKPHSNKNNNHCTTFINKFYTNRKTICT